MEGKKNIIQIFENKINRLWKLNPILPVKSTAEGLLTIIGDDEETGTEHNGGMVVCSEFGEWAQNLERSYNLGYKAMLTNLFDVPNLYDYKTKTAGTFLLRRPFITINAVSTLTWVQGNIQAADVSSGFFPRFLLFYPPQKNEVPPALPGPSPTQKVSIDLKSIIDSLQKPRVFELSPQGKEVFKAIHGKLYEKLFGLPEKSQEIIGPFVKRWSPYILKIGMLIELIDDPNSYQVKARSLLAATAIVEYAIKSTIFLFKNDLGESEQQRKMRIVLEYIAKNGGWIERGKLIASRVLAGGAPDYDNVLNNLDATGQLLTTKKAKQMNWRYTLAISN